MIHATAPEMRRSLELVNEFKKAGILFVPIPITSVPDYVYQYTILEKRVSEGFPEVENSDHSGVSLPK